MTGEISAVAKALRDYARANPHLVVKGGMFGDDVLSTPELTALADLPPRDVLLARFAGAIAAPLQQMAGLLQALPRNFAYGLSALIGDRPAEPDVPPEATAAPAAAAPTATEQPEAAAPEAATPEAEVPRRQLPKLRLLRRQRPRWPKPRRGRSSSEGADTATASDETSAADASAADGATDRTTDSTTEDDKTDDTKEQNGNG